MLQHQSPLLREDSWCQDWDCQRIVLLNSGSGIRNSQLRISSPPRPVRRFVPQSWRSSNRIRNLHRDRHCRPEHRSCCWGRLAHTTEECKTEHCNRHLKGSCSHRKERCNHHLKESCNHRKERCSRQKERCNQRWEACSCYLGFEEGTGEDTEEGTGEGTEEGTGEGTGEGTEGIVGGTAVDSKVGVLHTLRELDKVVVGSKVSGDLLQRVLKEVTRTFNTISF